MEKYDNKKTPIQKYFKIMLLYIALLALFTIELNYEINTPGGLINLNDRISSDDTVSDIGDINITYVNTKKGTIPMILLSYIMPNWDIESKEEIKIDDEDMQDVYKRGQIDLENVNHNALLVAFDTANQKYELKNKKVVVYHIFNEAKTDLRVGDEIISINGKNVATFEEIKQELSNLKPKEKIFLKVKRNGKTYNCFSQLIDVNGEAKIGIYLQEIFDIETDPEIKFEYKKREMGSSGGLMSTLAIYNMITKEDITKGKKIAGTGTMETDGTIGEIAGVKYKLIGAVRKKAEIFIVPNSNYNEAKKYIDEKHYKIKLIKAETFNQVIEELNRI